MAHEIKVIQLHGRTPEADESVLQALAKEGWELVQIDPQPASRWYYLRRDKPEQAQYIAQFTPTPLPDVESPTEAIEPSTPAIGRTWWQRLFMDKGE